MAGLDPAMTALTKAELAARNPRPLDPCFELGPGDLRMRAPAEAAIGSGHDILSADALGETHEALRDQLGMLDGISRVADDAGHQDLARGELDRVPHGVFVLMA